MLLGNPRNSGICASCFAENVAGALRLHGDPRMSYLRPEFPGFLLGATLAALAGRGFQSRSGSAPLVRFFLGAFLIIGSAVFLGCPIKVMLRLAGGDLTAFAGLGGLVAGAWVGVRFLKKGFFLGKSTRTGALAGWVLPGAMALLAVASVLAPAAFTGGLVGAAREHAPPLASLAIGLVVGALAQRSKFCVSGSLRNFFLTRKRRASSAGCCCCSSPRSASISPPVSFTRGSTISRARTWTGAGRRPGCFSSGWAPF